MKTRRFHRPIATVVAFAAIALPSVAQACSVCMGEAGSRTGSAANAAIFLMLGFLALVFAGIGAVAFAFYRRSHSIPAHLKFIDGAGEEPAQAK